MAKLRSIVFPLGALAVAACGEMTSEELDHLGASFACMERATAVFPVFAQMSDTSEEESSESSDDFHADAAGVFVWKWKVRGKNRALPDELECRGNLTSHTIELVQLNGVAKRPNPSEIWKYE